VSRRIQTVPHRSYPWTGIDPERRNTLMLVGGIVGVIVVALILAGYGYYNDKIAPGRETVLRIGDRSWSYDDLVRRTKAITTGDSSKLQEDVENALKMMRDEELVRQAGRLNGLTLTEEDVLQGFRDRYGLQAGASREIIRVNLRNEMSTTGLSLAEIEDMVRAQVLDKRMNARVKEALPAKAPHVQLGLIQLGTQSQALQLRQTILEEKESFAVVAARDSKHPSKDKAGDVGWVPRAALPKEVGDVAFSRNDLFLSDVIENEAGFFIIAVRGYEERELTDESKEQIVQQKRAEEMEKATREVGVAVDLTTGQQRRIALSLSTPPGVPGA
jgi:parvulin-like peptidyl-prolyl isomerase